MPPGWVPPNPPSHSSFLVGGADDCSNADPISGLGTFAVHAGNGIATTSPQQGPCASGAFLDVWFRWNSPVNGNVVVSLCGGTTVDTVLAVWHGPSCPTPSALVGCNDDFCAFQSQVSFNAVLGSSYLIQIGSFSSSQPAWNGSFTIAQPPPPAPNDNCSAPTAITGAGTFPVNTTGATDSPQQSGSCPTAHDDVWFRWTATQTANARVQLCAGTSADTVIAAYSGGACPSASNLLACNDDSCGQQSSISFPAITGNTYMLQMGAFGTTTYTGTFTIDFVAAQTEVLYSISYMGPTISQPATGTGTPITESDVLQPPFGAPSFGPLPPPQIVLTGLQLGLSQYSQCVGHPAGQPCHIEVDALSFGNDFPFTNTPTPLLPGPEARLLFSVDRFAHGLTGVGVTPNVTSENGPGVFEASADVFTPLGLPFGPLPPGSFSGVNVGVFDGNGLPSATGKSYPGLGLVEPNPPTPLFPPTAGDDVDALAVAPIPVGPNAAVYFSLDSTFVDPLTGVPNSGSAAAIGVAPGAVLKKLLSGGGITIYATPAQLGLDLAGPGTDDLDALILSENGDGVYQRSVTDYDWLSGATDMLLFSVRRGSAVIGVADSQFGIAIEPGDILAPPPPNPPGLPPRIFIAAENLGLETHRTQGVPFGDELDALATEAEPFNDCNHNGVEDAVDIATGASSDTNNNGIPDECEQNYSRYCFCSAGLGPCGNDDATAGCLNSTGMGGMLCSTGTASVSTDDMLLTSTGLPPGATALLFMGPNQMSATFGDGLRCINSPTYRLGLAMVDGSGSMVRGPGIVGYTHTYLPPAGQIHSGETWNFQVWYRNAASFCTTSTFNLTNGESVTFSP